jgi:hypothetical protein
VSFLCVRRDTFSSVLDQQSLWELADTLDSYTQTLSTAARSQFIYSDTQSHGGSTDVIKLHLSLSPRTFQFLHYPTQWYHREESRWRPCSGQTLHLPLFVPVEQILLPGGATSCWRQSYSRDRHCEETKQGDRMIMYNSLNGQGRESRLGASSRSVETRFPLGRSR